MITGVVLARNEEANIAECLACLRPHVAEIVLIDMDSSDRTVELARPFVAKILSHPLVTKFDAARNVAIEAARATTGCGSSMRTSVSQSQPDNGPTISCAIGAIRQTPFQSRSSRTSVASGCNIAAGGPVSRCRG